MDPFTVFVRDECVVLDKGRVHLNRSSKTLDWFTKVERGVSEVQT